LIDTFYFVQVAIKTYTFK